MNDSKMFEVGDLNNGVFFVGTQEEATKMYEECLSDGFFAESECEQERIDSGYSPRSEEEMQDEVKGFFFIREAEAEDEE